MGEHYNNLLEEEGGRSGLLGYTHHNISKQWDIHIPSFLPEKTKISDLDRVQCKPLFLFSCKCANSSLEQHCTSKYVNSLCPSPSKFMYFSEGVPPLNVMQTAMNEIPAVIFQRGNYTIFEFVVF